MAEFNEFLKNGVIAGFVDQTVTCRKELMPTILTNDKATGAKILTTIRHELDTCMEFWFSVAFVTSSGVACMIELLKELKSKSIPGKILVSRYQNFTQPEALRKLLQFENISLRISEENNFHAKAFLFKKTDGYNLIIGSSNLTADALCINKEWNLKVSSSDYGRLIIDTLKEFKKEFLQANIVDEEYISKYQEIYNEQKFSVGIKLDAFVRSKNNIVPNAMQQNALENLELLRKKGKRRALLISATGTGKTFLSAFDVLKVKPRKFLFIVHRLTIANEAMNSFRSIIGPSVSMGVFSGARRELSSDYLFCTVQTLSKRENLNLFDPDHFDYIVIDETHRSGAESYQNILSYFKPRFLLGMTATPERTDGYDIFKQFDYNIAYEIRLHKALEEQMLSPFHYYGVTDITVNGKVIDEDAAFNLLTSQSRVEHIIEKSKLYGCDDGVVRGLVFCRNIGECHRLSEEFNSRGFKTVSLTGAATETDREAAIQMLESDKEAEKIDYIFTVDIFNEGVDIPKVNQLILLRPTQSAIIFIQQLGRGLRKVSGKSYLTVIDFIGNYKNNFLVPIALFGDRSFDRETLRKLVSSGTSLIPGESTVNFDRIAKERIYESINNSNWQRNKDFIDDYKLLKFRIGTPPMMIDFFIHDARNPYQYVEHYKSFYNFLVRQESQFESKLSAKEVRCLELLSLEVANGVRYEETLLLKELMDLDLVSIEHLNIKLFQQFGYRSTEETWRSAVANVNLRFVRENNGGQQVASGVKYKLDIIQDFGEQLSMTEQFKVFLENETFRMFLVDLLRASDMQFKRKFRLDNFRNGFLLYERYSRKDVFRILNWKENPVAQNVGGYMMQSEKKDLAIFVTYHKDDEISSSIKYEERFLSSSVFEWMSKNRRNLNSPEIRALAEHNGTMRIPLFVKKSDDEGTEFYYIGDLTPIKSTFNQTTIKGNNNTDVSVVKVQFDISPAVDNNIYAYLTDN